MTLILLGRPSTNVGRVMEHYALVVGLTALLAVACGDSNTALSPAAPRLSSGAIAAGEAVTLGVQAMGANAALPTAVVESQGDIQPPARKIRDTDKVRWNVRTSTHGEATRSPDTRHGRSSIATTL